MYCTVFFVDTDKMLFKSEDSDPCRKAFDRSWNIMHGFTFHLPSGCHEPRLMLRVLGSLERKEFFRNFRYRWKSIFNGVRFWFQSANTMQKIKPMRQVLIISWQGAKDYGLV